MSASGIVSSVQTIVAEAGIAQVIGGLLVVLFGASIMYGAYGVIMDNKVVGPAETLEITDVDCSIIPWSGSHTQYTVELAIENKNSQSVNASAVTVSLYDKESDQLITADANWENKPFTRGAGADTVTINTAVDVSTPNISDRIYNVNVKFPEGSLNAGRCPQENIPALPSDEKEDTENRSDSSPPTDQQHETPILDRNASNMYEDHLPPGTKIIYNNTGWTAQAQNITISCSDNETGCAYIQWQKTNPDGTTDTQTISQNQTTITMGVEHDGLLELHYRGVDKAGNTEQWNTQTVRIDKQTPSTSISSANSWYGSEFTRFVADEAMGPSGLSHCDYRIKDGGENWSSWKQRDCRDVTVSVARANAACTTEGWARCRVQVRTWSRAGLNSTDTAYFDIDFEAPSTQIVSPESGATFSDNFTVYIADNSSSGFQSCRYRIEDSLQGSTGWHYRNCPDGDVEVTVGEFADCRTEGNGTCIVSVEVTDNADKTSMDEAAYTIDYLDNDDEDTNTTDTNTTDDEDTNTTDTNTTGDSNTTDDNTTDSTDTVDWYTHTIASNTDWNQGVFDGTAVLSDTLRIGYHDQEDNPIGYWRLDETVDGSGGTVQDASPTGNDGVTQNGVVTGATGIFGTNAFGFDTTDNYVDISDPSLDFSGETTVTLESWAKWDGGGDGGRVIIALENELELLVNANENWVFQVYDSGGEDYQPYIDATPYIDQWTHVVGVYDGAYATLYINGEKVDDIPLADTIYDGPSSYSAIGSNHNARRRYFSGRVDEVSVYDRALTPTEITQRYRYGQPFTGEYASNIIDTDATNNWTTLTVDANIPTDTDAEATFEALDSTATVVDSHTFSLFSDTANYTLDVQNSEDARIKVSGTSTDPEQSWEIHRATVHYNR